MNAVTRSYAKEEFARRGDAIYDGTVWPRLKAKDTGKFAAIDIEAGEFAIASGELVAGDKLRKRVPEAQIWMVQIGSAFVHRFGGRALPSAHWSTRQFPRFSSR